MRRIATGLAVIGCLQFAIPAQACVQITPSVRAWTQCSYKVASDTGDHRFLLNFAKAKERKQKLLPTAQPRWQKLEQRIVDKCGTYSVAAAADRRNLDTLNKQIEGPIYVPDTAFLAILDTGDIDKLVKNNA